MSVQVSEVRKQRARKLAPRIRATTPLRIPGPAWIAGAVLWLAAVLLVNSGRRVSYPGLVPGQIARVTVLAAVEFETLDQAGTDLTRDAAATAVAPVFRIQLRGEELRTADLLLDELKRLQEANPDGGMPRAGLDALGNSLRLLRLDLKPEQVAAAIPSNRLEQVRQVLRSTVQEVQQGGIISVTDRDTRFSGKASRGRIALLTGPTATDTVERDVDTLNTPVTALARLRERLSPLVNDPDVLLGTLLDPAVAPNLRFEPEMTLRRQDEARKAVAPLRAIVRAGTPLVEAGKPVTHQMVEDLRLHTDRLKSLEDANAVLARWAGSGMMLFAGLLVSGGIILLRRPAYLRQGRLLCLLVVLGFLPVALARLLVMVSLDWEVLPTSTLVYVLPYAISALLAATLVDSITAYSVSIWTGLATAMVLDASLGVFVLGSVSSVSAIFCAREMIRRSSLFRAGLKIGLLQAALSVAVGFINQLGWQALVFQGVAGLVGGLGVSVLALLLMPFFEYFGRLTSDIRLLELSDLGHPLLEKLAIDAPGTYHHSLMVASLAQAAANEVGANDLLVRVCAYFHDIGKMTKPEFFIENVPFRKNPHDELSPSMSTLVIVSHVKEGASLALRYKLPPPILDAILQHHGTSVVRYFYERAREQHREEHGGENGGADEPGEEQFRYPGPKPQSLEMGILMLADTIEAASRTLHKPSPATIERLVEELTAEKIADNQLDECGMTFAQLGRIKRSFIVTLNNMAHGRIVYPRHEDRTAAPTAPAPDPANPGSESGRVVGRPA